MTRLNATNHRISVKIAEPQLEFLENRAKELGLSSTSELLKWFLVREMDKFITGEQKQEKSDKKRISLRGIIRDGRVTYEDIEEVKREWEVAESQ
jgi:hypothetical protein